MQVDTPASLLGNYQDKLRNISERAYQKVHESTTSLGVGAGEVEDEGPKCVDLDSNATSSKIKNQDSERDVIEHNSEAAKLASKLKHHDNNSRNNNIETSKAESRIQNDSISNTSTSAVVHESTRASGSMHEPTVKSESTFENSETPVASGIHY